MLNECKKIGVMEWVKVFQESGVRHRGNMGMDLLGPFLRPQEAPGGTKYMFLGFKGSEGGLWFLGPCPPYEPPFLGPKLRPAFCKWAAYGSSLIYG